VVTFTFSAGFSRNELLEFNERTRSCRRSSPSELSYSIEMSASTGPKMETFFEPPAIVELKGGGCELLQSRTWILRGPRLVKAFPTGKSLQETLSYSEFEVINSFGLYIY
jgi:hypothetical protein